MTGKKDKGTGHDRADEVPDFRPFADDATARTIAGLSIENGTTRIAVHGSLDISRDQAGLAQARLLQATLAAIVEALEAEDLPERVSEVEDATPRTVKNPFA